MQLALAGSPALFFRPPTIPDRTALPLVHTAPTIPQATNLESEQQKTTRFAVIGDFGLKSHTARNVAKLVDSMEPDFIATVGDNNYPRGAAKTIDANIGKYYHRYIHPYVGNSGPGADENRFFPVLGNHDWSSIWIKDGNNFGPYFDYFTLPGNERYYTFQRGPVRCFMIDSDPHEPDGISGLSTQAMWLRDQLAASDAVWNLIFMHHPPYSSGLGHGSHPIMQWPFAEWGAHAVLAGHDHIYERIERDGMLYFVNGLGGKSRRGIRRAIDGSQIRFTGQDGAMRVVADESQITFEFLHTGGDVVDSHTLPAAAPSSVAQLLPKTQLIDVRVNNPNNDLVVAQEAGAFWVEQDPLALALGSRLTDDPLTTALRFPQIDLPPCTQIISAHLEFTACHQDDDDTSVLICGEKSGNAQEFTGSTSSVRERQWTENRVQWESIAPWEKIGQAYLTPDLSPVVQEIVHQPDWKNGNALVFFITGVGQRLAATCDLQPAAAPRLQIVYQTPEPVSQLKGAGDSASDRATIEDQTTEDQTTEVFLPLAVAGGCRS